jgi:hypothetical protein
MPLPTAAPLAAIQVTGTGATLQASVNARGNQAAVRFEYGLDETYGATAAAAPDSVSGNDDQVASAAISGLRPETTYHFRVVAECPGGVIRGPDATFTTGPGGLPPVFAGYAIATPWQTAATVSSRKLLARASDPDGGPLSVTAAGPASAAGGSAVLQADGILYTPPAGFSGADSFAVTIGDSEGSSVTGTVTVTVGEPPSPGGVPPILNPPRVTILPGGEAEVRFHGIPGRSYRLQRSTDMIAWRTIFVVTAGENGIITFNDENAPRPSAYYRLATP